MGRVQVRGTQRIRTIVAVPWKHHERLRSEALFWAMIDAVHGGRHVVLDDSVLIWRSTGPDAAGSSHLLGSIMKLHLGIELAKCSRYPTEASKGTIGRAHAGLISALHPIDSGAQR